MSSLSSEKEKMLAGELYKAFTPDLEAERGAAKDICFRYNNVHPNAKKERTEILRQLVGDRGFSDEEPPHIESPFHCDYGYNIKFGRSFYANHGCTILDCNSVTFGDYCFLGPGVVVSTGFHPLDPVVRASGSEQALPITFGNNVWIGANATILHGLKIGNNVVIGAGAVVTRSMPDNVVCVGVPAKILKTVTSEDAANAEVN